MAGFPSSCVLSHQFLRKLNLEAALGFTVDENNRAATCGLSGAEALVVVYYVSFLSAHSDNVIMIISVELNIKLGGRQKVPDSFKSKHVEAVKAARISIFFI